MKVKKLVLSAILSSLSFVLYEFVDIPIPPTESPLLTLSLGIIPIVFIAYYCGIYYSCICSIIVDLMGYFLVGVSRGYAFNIGFTINALIGGIIFGLIFLLKDKISKKQSKIIIISLFILFSVISIPFFYFLVDKARVISKYNNSNAVLIISLIALLLNIGSLIYTLFLNKIKDSDYINISFILYQYIVSLFLTPLWLSLYYKIDYIYLWTTRLITVPLTFLIYSIITKLIIVPINKIYKIKHE